MSKYRYISIDLATTLYVDGYQGDMLSAFRDIILLINISDLIYIYIYIYILLTIPQSSINLFIDTIDVSQ